jgi:hypothetical protein
MSALDFFPGGIFRVDLLTKRPIRKSPRPPDGAVRLFDPRDWPAARGAQARVSS